MAEGGSPQSPRRNAIWSIGERALGVVVSIVSSPLIVHGLGERRYGILSIGLTTLGFLAFLDLGITAAAVREIAHARGTGDKAAAVRAFATAMAIYLGLALLAGGGLFLAAPWLVRSVFSIDPADYADATFVLRMAGVGLGLNLGLAPMTAVPRALQRFDISTSIGMALTILTTAGVVLAARADSLRGAVVVQIASTLAAMLAYAWATRRLMPELSFVPRIDRGAFRILASFAVFQVLGQIFGTLSSYSDRLVLAAWLPPSELTWYQVPAGLSQKIHVLVAAAAAFVFPRVAELSARQDRAAVAQLYGQGVRLTMLAAVLVGVPLASAGEAFLRDWMGSEFAGHAASSLQYTAVAYLLYCATVMPVLTLLGLGKAREAAMVSLLIGGSNAVLALLLTPWRGRDGAGLALCLSMGLGLLPLLWVHREVQASRRELLVTALRLAPVVAVAALASRAVLWALPAHLLSTLTALGTGALAGLAAHLLLPAAPGPDRALLLQWRRRANG